MPHPVRQMRLRKQRRDYNEENNTARVSEEGAVIALPVHEGEASTESVATSDAVIQQHAPVRLHKIMADHGLGSRRGLEDAIREGKVTVNGEVAHIGQTVQPGDQIHLEGQLIELNFSAPTFPRVLIYHKPSGEIVSRDDPGGRADVFERLPAISHGRWISIGRLDLNSEGLLLFTDSGELAHRLMHPRHDIEREYAVRVWGALTGEQCRKLLQGVQLEDGLARVVSLKDQGGEGANHWYHVVLKEGRYREVRRIFAALELTVSRLIRVRYANLQMPSTLRRGDLEELTKDQVTRLMRVVGLFPSHFSEKDEFRGTSSPRTQGHRSSKFSRNGSAANKEWGSKERDEYPNRKGRFDKRTSSSRYGQHGETYTSKKDYSEQSRTEHSRNGASEFKHRKPFSKNGYRSGPRTDAQENPVSMPGNSEDSGDLNLKGGGGRHPFKRYSQRRVMSHQREDGGSPQPVQSNHSYSEQQDKIDEDALLQQRYAEQERRGELRGLAGQTLGAESNRTLRNENTGHSRPFYKESQNTGYKGNGRSSSRFSKPSSRQTHRFDDESYGNRLPDNFGNVDDSASTNKGRTGYFRKRRNAPSEHNSEHPNTGNSFNRRTEGTGYSEHSRPFYKKGFKKD